MIPFTGYAPDLPPETPGVITDCSMLIPSPSGYYAQGAELDAGIDALAASARTFSATKRLDGTKRIFAATQTKIYELGGTTWTDRSAAGDYDLGTDTSGRARFTQFGNVTIASVGTNDRLQASATLGAFAAIAAAPYAWIVESVNNFVFAFNFVDDTHGLGTQENGWWCSAIGDYTDWTPSTATQSVSGQFLDSPGKIVGAKKLGDNIVAYKEDAAYIGTYVGAPIVWSWTQLPGAVGTLSHEAIISIGTVHFLVDKNDFWMFDGARFERIGTPIRETFFTDLADEYRERVTATHDKTNSLVYWFYPSMVGNGAIDKCVVYNYKTNQWGRSDVTIEAVSNFTDAGVTYEDLGTLYSTYDDLPVGISYDSSFWVTDSEAVAYIKPSDHKVKTFGGTPTTSSLTTGHVGDIHQFTTLKKVRPRFIVTPISSTLEYFYSNTNADAMTTGVTANLLNNTYDLLWSARWHKAKMNFVGATKILGYKPEYAGSGSE